MLDLRFFGNACEDYCFLAYYTVCVIFNSVLEEIVVSIVRGEEDSALKMEEVGSTETAKYLA